MPDAAAIVETAPGRRSGRLYLLLLAVPVAFFGLFLLIPLALLLLVSFHGYDPRLIVGPAWTAENYLRFFRDSYYRNVLLYTFRLAGVTSAASLVIAYPLAYYLARTTSRFKGWYVFLLLAPLMVGIIVRTYGWLVVLGREGTINSLLLTAGLVHSPLRLLYTNGAVILGLIEVLLPYMVLPLISAIQKVDRSVEDAARSLGAPPADVFRRVVLPLSVPGIISGLVIVFTLSAGAIVTPALLGSPRSQTMGTLIYQLMTATLNWPFGSAAAFILLGFEALPTIALLTVIKGRPMRGEAFG